MKKSPAQIAIDSVLSWPSAIFHTILFVYWFSRHLDVNLLTNIVSLEAIYMSIFVGIGQKHTEAKLKKHITNTMPKKGKS